MSSPGSADVPVGMTQPRADGDVGKHRNRADEDVGAPRNDNADEDVGMTQPRADSPGSADVPVGMTQPRADGDIGKHRNRADKDVGAPRNDNADEDVGMTQPRADGDVGKHRNRADEDVGMTQPRADEDVGAPRDSAPRGWYSRGYLPHCDAPNLIQFVTYRLADSLPQTKLTRLKAELGHLSEKQREVERRKRIEEWLDAGMGCCALAHPDVAQYIQNSFLYFHGERYHLHAWCIMPNHVHVLIEPLIDLATIVQGWKSYSARWVLGKNEQLALKIPFSKQLWMREYWDRYIRDARHYQRAVEYIHQNPVKAGLCNAAEAWPWSSAFSDNAE